MRQLLLITSITLREALRKKVWLWAFVILAGLIVIDSIVPRAFSQADRLQMMPQEERLRQGIFTAQFVGARIILFFTCIIAIVLAAGQISAEIDKGVLSSVVTKPIFRFQVVMGKWLGVVLFADVIILLCIGVNWALCSAIYGHLAGYAINWPMLGVMLLYPVLYGTLTIAFSSFGSMVMSLMLTATLYSFTFIGDTIIHIIAEITQNESLRKLEVLSDWLIPHGRLATWFGSLEQGMVPAMRREMGRRAGEHLTYTSFDQFYIFAYIIGFLLLANIVFSRRDLN